MQASGKQAEGEAGPSSSVTDAPAPTAADAPAAPHQHPASQPQLVPARAGCSPSEGNSCPKPRPLAELLKMLPSLPPDLQILVQDLLRALAGPGGGEPREFYGMTIFARCYAYPSREDLLEMVVEILKKCPIPSKPGEFLCFITTSTTFLLSVETVPGGLSVQGPLAGLGATLSIENQISITR